MNSRFSYSYSKNNNNKLKENIIIFVFILFIWIEWKYAKSLKRVNCSSDIRENFLEGMDEARFFANILILYF